MKQRTQDFALGLTAIVMLAVFLASVLFLYPTFQRTRGRSVEIRFRHEDGLAPLKPGARILLGGSLDVGRVLNVRIAQAGVGPQRHTYFVVDAEIRPDIPLYGNSQITTDQPAIGGNGFVSILNVGKPDVPLTGPIDGLPPQSFAAAVSGLARRLVAPGGILDNVSAAVDPDAEKSIVRKLLTSLDDVNTVTRELRNQASPLEHGALLHKVHQLLDDLNTTTGAVRSELAAGNQAGALGKLHVALTHLEEALREAAALMKESRPIVQETLASVNSAVRAVDKEMLPALQAELDSTNPSSTLGKLHAAMNRVNESLDDVRAMTTAGERTVVLSRPTVEKILGNFRDMSEQLRQASQEVLLNPSKLIWGPTQQREDKLLIFRAASNFAEAARELDAAAGRLQALSQSLAHDAALSDADREELKKMRAAVDAAFERFGRAETALWEQLK